MTNRTNILAGMDFLLEYKPKTKVEKLLHPGRLFSREVIYLKEDFYTRVRYRKIGGVVVGELSKSIFGLDEPNQKYLYDKILLTGPQNLNPNSYWLVNSNPQNPWLVAGSTEGFLSKRTYERIGSCIQLELDALELLPISLESKSGSEMIVSIQAARENIELTGILQQSAEAIPYLR